MTSCGASLTPVTPFWRELEAFRLENRAKIGESVKDLGEFIQLVKDTCGALDNLAHLSVEDPFSYSLYVALLEQGKYEVDDDYIFPLVLDPQTAATYKYMGAVPFPYTLDVQINQSFTQYPELDAICFRFPSFFTMFETKSITQLARTLNYVRGLKHVIFDITGNGGGFDAFWVKQIVSAFAEPVEWRFISYARLTDVTAPNYTDAELHPLEPDSPLRPAFADDLGLTHWYENVYTLPIEDYPHIQYDKPVTRWLLVDEGVYSAADMFTNFCKATGWATVVGHKTGGDGILGRSPITTRLDNTGLLLRFTTETGMHPDGTPSATNGTMPDVLCVPGESPLDTCLQLIKEMNEAGD